MQPIVPKTVSINPSAIPDGYAAIWCGMIRDEDTFFLAIGPKEYCFPREESPEVPATKIMIGTISDLKTYESHICYLLPDGYGFLDIWSGPLSGNVMIFTGSTGKIQGNIGKKELILFDFPSSIKTKKESVCQQ